MPGLFRPTWVYIGHTHTHGAHTNKFSPKKYFRAGVKRFLGKKPLHTRTDFFFRPHMHKQANFHILKNYLDGYRPLSDLYSSLNLYTRIAPKISWSLSYCSIRTKIISQISSRVFFVVNFVSIFGVFYFFSVLGYRQYFLCPVFDTFILRVLSKKACPQNIDSSYDAL